MRILIADDESLVRYGLISVLKEILPDTTSIIEAANGSELVELVRSSRPHIAFVDIRMPGMSGLEAIAEAAADTPNISWVILTGHADFAYARTAVKLGVEDFLLKPAVPVEIADLITRLTEKVRRRQKRGNRELEAKIAAVLGETTTSQHDRFFAKPRYWQAGMIVQDTSLPDERQAVERRNLAGRITTLLESIEDCSGGVVSMRNGNLLVVLSTPTGGVTTDGIITLWERRFVDFNRDVTSTTPPELGITWLLTRIVQDPEALFADIDTLCRNAPLRFLCRNGPIMSFARFAGRHWAAPQRRSAEILEELGRTARFGREDDFHGLVHQLKTHIAEMPPMQQGDDGPNWFSRMVIPLPKGSVDNLNTLADILHDETHAIFAGRELLDDSRTDTLVERALALMEHRYRETIGIAQVAEELGVTPNYLSTVFKKETGTAFTRRLTELRLKKSRELLVNSRANIGDIALSLGYQSTRHFTRLFKERYGETPSQWMNDRRK